MGKGEIAHHKQFLLFPQCFQKTCTADRYKQGLVCERVKSNFRLIFEILLLYLIVKASYWINQKPCYFLDVHVIDNFRDADETIAWIMEKDAILSSDDYGRDLASVQALRRKHEGVERDLAALNEKVTLPSLI